MTEVEVFRKQIYCIEESTCDIFVTFRRPRIDSAPPVVIPHCDSAPGELCPLALLVMPLHSLKFSAVKV